MSRKIVENEFRDHLTILKRRGDMKITLFKPIYQGLMPVQQQKMKDLCGENLSHLLDHGRIVIFGLVYTPEEIDVIDQMTPA